MNTQAVMDNTSLEWHLDKRVPIALIVTIALQFAGIVWWGAQISARVDTLERAIVVQNEDHDRLVRVESTVSSIDQRLERIENRVR
jgi:hypothetical protein